jgi:putative transposase
MIIPLTVGEDTHPRQPGDSHPRTGRPRRVLVVHPGAAYFVTTVMVERSPLLLRPEVFAGMLTDLWVALRIKETECYALAILPDHAHLVLRPVGAFSLSEFMHSWKRNASRNANKLLKNARFGWQPSFMEHAIRDERDLLAHYRYILGNPIKHGANGLAKCYYDGLVQRRLQGGQDVYPGLRTKGAVSPSKEIDRAVHDLYDLTEKEIAMVEGSGG